MLSGVLNILNDLEVFAYDWLKHIKKIKKKNEEFSGYPTVKKFISPEIIDIQIENRIARERAEENELRRRRWKPKRHMSVEVFERQWAKKLAKRYKEMEIK